MNEGAIALFDLIDQIVEMPDDLDEQAMALFQELINSSFNIEAKERFIRSQVDSLYQRDVPKTKALEDAEKLNHIMDEVIADYGNLTDTKKQFITTILSQIKELTMESAKRYRGAEKTIYFQKIHPNAKLPTYAHQDDACADLYAPEDIVVPANARGFKVDIGLAAAIPEGWEVQIRPRSGMSMKTPLRISNAGPGTIDSGFLNSWGVLFDNLSNEDYKITAGDRIAQIALKPVYYFCGEEVEDVHNIKQTERDMTGFGDSGK